MALSCALQTDVGQAAVALLFRSLECQSQLWLCWDQETLCYALLHLLAAYAGACLDGGKRSWFRAGVDTRVAVTMFGSPASKLHDVLHDLLAPPPVYLRPEVSGTRGVSRLLSCFQWLTR